MAASAYMIDHADELWAVWDGQPARGYGGTADVVAYDIHSPRVPSTEEIEDNLRRALQAVEPARLWVNPDCGLKTRAYPETAASLRNMVAAAHRVRQRRAG